MTHDRCSELLAAYARGELAPAEAGDVRAHLDGCEDCRAEHRAVVAMGAGVEPLDDIERARLQRGLAQELFTPRANADVAGRGASVPRWVRWGAPLAASAAVLAAVAVMTTGGGMDSETASIDAGGRSEQRTAEDGLGDGAGGGGGGADAAAEPETSRALAGSAAGSADFDGPRPQFEGDAGSLAPGDVKRIGRGLEPFAASYSPSDGATLYEKFLDGIAATAGEAAEEVRECAATIPQDGTLLPAYGASARYDDRDALVLGFVTADPGSKDLDRYLVWIWARGDCSQPIDSFFEELGP